MVLHHEHRLAADRGELDCSSLAVARGLPRRTPPEAGKRGTVAPWAGRTLDVDAAARLLDDRAGRRESEARAATLRLGGEEWLEDPAEGLLRHARARVSNGEQHVRSGAKAEPPRTTRASSMHVPGHDREATSGAHRVAGVGRQVHDDLLELARVDPDGPGSLEARRAPGRPALPRAAGEGWPAARPARPRAPGCGSTACLRAKDRSWRVRRAARSAEPRISLEVSPPGVAGREVVVEEASRDRG